MGEDEDFIMDEFEWALKDPTEEKLRQLGEVVSIITTKLIDAFGKLEGRLDDIETQLSGFSSKISSLESRAASGGISAGPSAAAAEAPAMASAPMAAAPKPKPAGAGGGMTMMGELKQLLAARRKKADTT
ncbi:MAG: hypothetical protein ACXADL_01005 [Candidatus Thorarchaeota archaeon]|jgi:hypothetical protein